MCRISLLCCAAFVVHSIAPTRPVTAAGLPEPPLVIYGQLRDNPANARITAGTLTWTWSPVGGGNPVVVSAVLTNVNDQFSFVLFVPCESEISGVPVSANTLRLVNPGVTYTRTNVLWNGQPVTLRNSAQATVAISPATRGRIERLDLGLGNFPADSDGDGLPDWWESQYPLAANANGDTDGDGLTNLREYIAGTNPEDGDSSFEFVTVVEEIPGVMLIQWSSVPGKSYTLLRAPTLSLNPLDYQPVRTGISAQGNLTTYRDTAGAGHQFYRLRIAE
ncbi:MAG: thrombospondin type 3 repeat-containing protein [Limisphaerales bacterium]